MKAHLATLLIGSLFVGSAACLRGTGNERANPIQVLHRPHAPLATQAVPEAGPAKIASLEAASTAVSVTYPIASEPAGFGLGWVEVTVYTEASHAADLLEEDLLAAFPFTGAQEFTLDRSLPESLRSMAEEWNEWRRVSIQALPEDLREKSDHRRAIDAQFKAALQGLIPAEEVEILEAHGFDVDIISRPPPPGGWSIGGVGFTDIDERVEIAEGSVQIHAFSEPGGQESFLEADK